MQIKDFFKNFYFHDSLVKEIDYYKEKKELKIKIELYNWKQAGYKENDPEMQIGSLTFYNVLNFDVVPKDNIVDDDSILEIKVKDLKNSAKKYIEIILEQDDITKILSFESDDVEWLKQ